LGLSDRQIKAVLYIKVKERGRITNLEYLEINAGITDRTALRDLDTLIEKGVFRRVGEKKAAYYELANVGIVSDMSDKSGIEFSQNTNDAIITQILDFHHI
jgi:hypothetical protein